MMARTTAVARRTTGGLMKNKTGQTKKVSGKNSGMQHMVRYITQIGIHLYMFLFYY